MTHIPINLVFLNYYIKMTSQVHHRMSISFAALKAATLTYFYSSVFSDCFLKAHLHERPRRSELVAK